jgi:hypothetical protein
MERDVSRVGARLIGALEMALHSGHRGLHGLRIGLRIARRRHQVQ